MNCRNCGAENSDAAKFCVECGSELVKPIQSTRPVASVAAEPMAVSPWRGRRAVLLGLGALVLVGIVTIASIAGYRRSRPHTVESEVEEVIQSLITTTERSILTDGADTESDKALQVLGFGSYDGVELDVTDVRVTVSDDGESAHADVTGRVNPYERVTDGEFQAQGWRDFERVLTLTKQDGVWRITNETAAITPEPTVIPTATPSPTTPTPTGTPESTRAPTPTPAASLGIPVGQGTMSVGHERLELVGQMGGESFAVAMQGNFIFLGVGPRLAVLDVSNPITPTLVGQTELLPGVVQGVAVDGDYAYVAAGDAGLREIDISDPADPTEVGFTDTPGDAMGLALAGRYVYIAASAAGLRVVDISNPHNPTEVGFYDTPGYAKNVAIAGRYAYVADSDAGLRVVDISNPRNPTEVGFHPTPGAAWGVALAGQCAYIAASGAGLRVMDISAPTTPREVGFHEMAGDATSVAVAAGDPQGHTYAYVAVRYVHIIGGLGSLRVVDISTPSNPTGVGHYYATPGDAVGVKVTGRYAYVAASAAGLRVLNISNPRSPTEVGFYDTPGWPEDVAVTGRYAYVADGGTGLRVVDISDPHSPMEVSLYDTPGYASGVAVAGHYAYVADLGAGLRMMDISTPANPREVGSYDMAESAWGVAVAGDYAYVAVKDAGLRVMDVSTPISPTEVGYYDTPGDAMDVEIAGRYAYVAASDAGLRVLDISTPISPTEVGFYDTPGDAEGVAIAAGDPQGRIYAYVSERDIGLRVVDVSDPTNPKEVGFYDTPGWTAGIAVAEGYVYVADGPAGLVVLRHAAGAVSDTKRQTNIGYLPYVAANHTQQAAPDSIDQIAFVSDRDGNWEIYLMNADGTGLTNLTDNPAGDGGPAWSPDGQLLAFSSGRSGVSAIYVMNADGTGVHQLTDLPEGGGGPVWSPDGSRIAFCTQVGFADELSIYWVSADGSDLTKVYSQPGYGGRITWSPDSQRLLFDARGNDDFDLFIVNLDGSGLQRIASSEWWDYTPAWSPDGQHIAFGSDRAGGRPDIWVANQSGSGAQNVTGPIGSPFGPVWSPDSQWIALMSGGYGFYIVRPNGSQLTKLSDLRFTDVGAQWSWSPDSTRLAFLAPSEGNDDIYVVGINGSGLTNLTNHPARDSNPVWRPVASSSSGNVEPRESQRAQIAYVGGDGNLWLMDSDGTDQTQMTRLAAGRVVGYDWASDGRQLVFAQSRESASNGQPTDVFLLDLESGNQTKLLDDAGYWHFGGIAWSPLGDQIALTTDLVNVRVLDVVTGNLLEVYKQELYGIGAGSPPKTNAVNWSSDGSYLAVDMIPSEAVVLSLAGQPTVELHSSQIGSEMVSNPQLSPDGLLIAWTTPGKSRIASLIITDIAGELIAQVSVNACIENGRHVTVSWSPDGHHLAVSGDGGLCVVDFRTGATNPLVSDHGVWNPSWSPSGDHIVFNYVTELGSMPSLEHTIAVAIADGSWVVDLGIYGSKPSWRPTVAGLSNSK